MKSFWLAALIAVSPLAVEQAVAQAPAPAQSFAPIPLPRLKPEPPRLSEYISNRDAALLRRGLSAASRGDWSRLKDAKEAINDDTARNILFWQGSSHFSKAQALLPHMGQADRAVMDARMKLARRSRGVNRAVAAVPQARLPDPGFRTPRA